MKIFPLLVGSKRNSRIKKKSLIFSLLHVDKCNLFILWDPYAFTNAPCGSQKIISDKQQHGSEKINPTIADSVVSFQIKKKTEKNVKFERTQSSRNVYEPILFPIDQRFFFCFISFVFQKKLIGNRPHKNYSTLVYNILSIFETIFIRLYKQLGVI